MTSSYDGGRDDRGPRDADLPETRLRGTRGGLDDEPVLPDLAGDDDPRSWGEHRDADSDDERILREVPPHHG